MRRGGRDRHADPARAGGADRGARRASSSPTCPSCCRPSAGATTASGEGGVALRRPALGGGARARRGRLGHPGRLGRGPRRPRCGAAPRLEWVQARNAGAGEQLGQALQLAPEDARRVTVTTSSGVHARPAGRVRDLRPARLRQGPARPCSPTSASATGRPGSTPVGELRDRTLLIVGLGEIGTETARLAQAFGMRVLGGQARRLRRRPARRRAPPRDRARPRSWRRPTRIVVTLPLTDATRGLLDADTLARGQARRRARQRRPRRGDRRGRARRAPAGRHLRRRRARRLRRGAAARRTARCGGSTT